LASARNKAAIAGLASALVIGICASVPSGAASSGCTSDSGGTTVCSSGSAGGGGHYVNPFKRRRWYAGRIDMGVDYVPRGRRRRVVAIGDAKIKEANNNSGWPGGHFMYYKLLNGDHAGKFIYVAEQLRRLKPAGTRVQAGQRIATALPGGSGLEIGWANRHGEPRAGPCYTEGMKTHSGREMARFLRGLGAEVGDRPGPVPDYPSGKRC
jgi:murein DD-endopeptidase MepM/ murein hydrolase activator NlpD